jgi:hypothetical protein
MKHNPVAKFAHRVNKATIQRDRTKYQRKKKHKGDVRDDRSRPFSWAVTPKSLWFGYPNASRVLQQ